jgi:mannitol-1-phosphate/altronate dehydrogenase
MSTFLGIGAGPIQAGIFVSGAARGGFSRIVLADVDEALVDAVRRAGSITVHTAGSDAVKTDTYADIEIYNPFDEDDLETLTAVASEAVAISTALPSTVFYRNVAPWLTEAFQAAPERRRYVYTAENSTTAAEELQELVGAFPETHYLDTVIGKMSKVFTVDDSELPPLAPGFERGHLVEAFNEIYTAYAPGIADVGIEGLYPKPDLVPFEEAKLYGHNTVHFVLALLLRERGGSTMDEAAGHPELMDTALSAMVDECGGALCRKHAGADPFFESDAFRAHAEDLVKRMTSPVLKDDVARVLRDMERKLGWDDRVAGAMRLCLAQDVTPTHLMAATELAARTCFGWDRDAIAKGLAGLWRDAPQAEVAPLVDRIVDLVPDLPCDDP